MMDTEQEIAHWFKQHKINRDDVRQQVFQARAAAIILDECLDSLASALFTDSIDLETIIRSADKEDTTEDIVNEIIENEINASRDARIESCQDD